MIEPFAKVLGLLINIIYNFINDYGITVIIFTILSKIILFPINILIQKNSIKMIKIKPKIEELKYKYAEDKEKFMEKQIDLFDKEKYKPSLGVIPLLLQIPIILALIKVIEKPSYYITNFTNSTFLGIDLSQIPTISSYILIPILAGISAILLCIFQNKENVLQKEESLLSKMATFILTTVLTVYFVFLVPIGVALYWIIGNILAILQMYILNAIYPPKKYIDYKQLEYWRELNKEKKLIVEQNKKREKQDYKKFFKQENVELIFYSEKNGFYKYFSGIIDYILQNSNIEIHYITSDPNDNIFNKNNNKLKPYYIGRNKLIPLFMKIDAKLVLMTTPDLRNILYKKIFS